MALVLKKRFRVDPVDSVMGRVFTWDEDDREPLEKRTLCRVAMHGNARFEAEMRDLFRRLDEEWAAENNEIKKAGFRERKALTKAQEEKREAEKKAWREERITEEVPAIYSRCVWLGADRLYLDQEEGTEELILCECGPATFPAEIMADEKVFWAKVLETAPVREAVLRDRRFREFFDDIHRTCLEQGNFHLAEREENAKNSPKSSDGDSSGDHASNF